MCGIIGYIGNENNNHVITDCLRRIEYRGYDSAGIATVDTIQNIRTTKVQGGIDALEKRIGKNTAFSGVGIGHTRWATHGEPSGANAHPHSSPNFWVVHNGIIENYGQIKEVLISEGFQNYSSQTDTEILTWLIERNYQKIKDPRRAITNALKTVRGTFGLAIIFKETPAVLYLAKRGSPSVIGVSASAIYASRL